MYLKPNFFKYKTKFKNRRFFPNSKQISMSYGSIAIILRTHFYINAKQILKLKLFFKKINKKQDKTKRYFILKTFPYYPLTKKPQGLRMGKGTGKLNGWVSKVKSGSSIIEFKGIRYGRAKLFFNQFRFKSYLNLSLVIK